MTYKPSNPKIDLYLVTLDGTSFHYLGSTNWSRTLKEAKAKFLAKRPDLTDPQVRAVFAIQRSRKAA